MKISAVTSASVGPEAQPTSMAQKVRALRMTTNATPGYVPEAAPDPASNPSLTIPDAIEDKDGAVVEATEPLSPQIAAVARAKRALQVKEREIADREKAVLAKETAAGGWIDPARLKSDPLGVLLATGVTYEQLTEAVVNSSDANPKMQALEDKMRLMEEGFEKKLTDRETQAEQAALAEMRREAVLLSSQGEDFELVRETNSIPAVMTLIERTYRESGEVLDVRAALKLVEDELFTDSLKLANLKKIQSQFAPAAPVSQPPQLQRQMRTLTNRDTASVALSRKARALAAFNGTLKK